MTDDDVLPDNCAGCGYHLKNFECRRHAPHPGHDEDDIPALWNFTKDAARCSVGTTIKAPVSCDDCAKWWQPDGKPITPRDKQGLPDAWWEHSGYCTSNAPGAAFNEGLWTFWRVTSVHPHKGTIGGCGDGESITAALEAAEAAAARKP